MALAAQKPNPGVGLFVYARVKYDPSFGRKPLSNLPEQLLKV
jgi:hypothetical protein